VTFFGLVDHDLSEAIELYPSRDEAERALVDVLSDEPQWEGRFSIEMIDLGSWSPN
jgi:hypothetical protein